MKVTRELKYYVVKGNQLFGAKKKMVRFNDSPTLTDILGAAKAEFRGITANKLTVGGSGIGGVYIYKK